MKNKEKIIKNGPIELWTESFGSPSNPAVILVMGMQGQSISWPINLVKKLVDNNFFVIRFDNRDTGFSSRIDFDQNPYKLSDMAKDIITILDDYNIKKAHIVGLSMGGFIGQLIAADYPDRTLSLTAISSSPEEVLGPTDNQEIKLPPPTEEFRNFFKLYKSLQNDIPEEKLINYYVEYRKIVTANDEVFDEKQARKLEKLTAKRNKSFYKTPNHLKAMSSSPKRHEKLKKIIAPTLIIHGDRDPLFPVEHGKAMAQLISNAKLVTIPEMGHLITPEPIVNKITPFIIEHIKNK